jgi:protein TonB
LVTIGVLVDYDGTVKSTSPVSGDPVLADVATRAIMQWQFKPFIINGEAVEVESCIVMKFSKKRAEVDLGTQ